MRLVRLEKAWSYEIREVIEKNKPVSAYETAELINQKFTVLKFSKKKEQNPLWRLTILFYFLFFVLIIFTFPFKYLLTGTAQYEFNSTLGKFYRAWQVKLGL